MIEWIEDHRHLEQVQEKHREFLILVFYANFSSTSKRALAELEQFSRESKQTPVYIIDVEKIKGVHKQFGVENVPTVLALKNGEVSLRIEGVESAQFYARILLGAHPLQHRKGQGKISHKVIVYSGPGCPACGTAKAYLRRRSVSFREIDIARDQHATERLVRRSGQMAVPQIDIDGHLVVGFDQTKIDRLLSD
ncbi:MAG: thioredoxin family protein [Candidatus Omnitrophica bacterium]|nr:thioredoxin family protein [Candidatus Omnitrophota bacterium]